MSEKENVSKILFIVLAIITFVLLENGLFEIEFIDDLSQDRFYYKGGVLEVLEYAEKYGDFFADMSIDLENGKYEKLQTIEWFVKGGVFLYLFAAFMVFVKCEFISNVLTVLGAISHFIWISVTCVVLGKVVEATEKFGVIEFFSGNMWFYFVLNIALVIIATIFFDDNRDVA